MTARTPSSRATAAAVPAGSGAPAVPTRTRGAWTRAARHGLGVALVAGLNDALDAGEHRDQHDRRRQGRGAPAVGGEPRTGEQAGCPETAQRGGERRGGDAEEPAAEEANAHGEQDPAEHGERHRPVAGEQDGHRGAAGEARNAGQHADQPRARMLDRDLAQGVGRRDASGAPGGGGDRDLRDHDAHAQRGGEGDRRVRGRERGADDAMVRERRDDRVRQRPAGEHAERAGDERDEQRLAGDQPADLPRRGAEGAQDGGLAPALGDCERERPGDDEQRDRARDAAEGTEDRDQAGTVGRRRIARIGVRRVRSIEDVDPRSEALAQALTQGSARGPVLGDHADGVDLSGGAGQLRGGRRREEHGGLALRRPRRRSRRGR